MEQEVTYCENCGVVEVAVNEKYCAGCLGDIVADMAAVWTYEQIACEKGLN